MNWIRKHSFLTMLTLFTVFTLGVMYITDEDVAQTETISIEYGESLWSLADQYRGKMTKQEWIQQVEKMNEVHAKNIVAGASIEIPIMKHAIYLNELQEQDPVKVAKK